VRDDSEFEAFAEASAKRLRETAFLLCRDWHLAQDLTQIALIKVYRAWRRISNDDPLTYAKKVLFRAYLDHRRRRSFTDMTVASPPEPDAVQDSPELRLTLIDALARLSPRDRAIVVLRYLEDHSVRAVAEMLGLSEGTVKVQSQRARADLRRMLAEESPARSARP
jgi:RNA polymerase sigma-70 factor (sigma-E family)